MELSSTSTGKQHSALEMFPLVELWQTSVQTQKEFCQEQGIKPHVFTYWVGKYKKQRAGSEETRGFVPIAIEEQGSAGYYAEISYPDGTRLRFGRSVSVDQIRQLLGGSAR